MVTKVQSWGKSQCLRLSKRIIEDARVSVGDEVDVAVRDGIIVLTPVKRSRGKVSLRKLVAQDSQGPSAGRSPVARRWGKRRPRTCKRQRSSKMVEARPSDYQCSSVSIRAKFT